MVPKKVTVKVLRLAHGRHLPLPDRATAGSAALDLRAAISGPLTLAPHERRLIPTGLAIELPEAFEAQVRPRSGLALRTGVTVLNSPGTIDSDYRGEVGVILINLSAEPATIQPGERIAQLVVAPVAQVLLVEVDELTGSGRGAGGFGHTGAG